MLLTFSYDGRILYTCSCEYSNLGLRSAIKTFLRQNALYVVEKLRLTRSYEMFNPDTDFDDIVTAFNMTSPVVFIELRLKDGF